MTDLTQLICSKILEDPLFSSGTFSGIGRALYENEWKKISIKPVLIKGERLYQFNYYDNVKGITKNYIHDDAKKELSKISLMGFKSIYLKNQNTGTQIQITKKSKILIKKHKDINVSTVDLSHDNKKARIIQNNSDNLYLNILGLSDENGHIKPSMQGKYKQIDEFVKLLQALENWDQWEEEINIVDCGSGNAYLTFASYHYFKNLLNKSISVTGIDIDPTSIESNKRKALALGWENIDFEVSNIIGFLPATPPTVTLALHACDTATDEALMKGINWNSSFIVSVPCCHHNLQERLKKSKPNADFAGVIKNNILRERLGDIQTDSFRAMILEIMGYKTDVIQYVSTDHTAKNLLIRAKKISSSPLYGSVENYLNLKKVWDVTPILEELLKHTSDFNSRVNGPA